MVTHKEGELTGQLTAEEEWSVDANESALTFTLAEEIPTALRISLLEHLTECDI